MADGEDGVIEEILARIVGRALFVEIGASDGEENCTRNLVEAGVEGCLGRSQHDQGRGGSGRRTWC